MLGFKYCYKNETSKIKCSVQCSLLYYKENEFNYFFIPIQCYTKNDVTRDP